MGKKIFSLCMALALCLSLLPATALAAGTASPHSLYVGNTNFASTIYPDNAAYWTSSDGGTNWTSQQEEPTGDSYIYYNGQGTLTLHNANIQGQYDSSNGDSGYGIYAVGASGSAVSLTIKLEGTNTVSGWSGIFVHAVDGAASLSISGTGSLAAEGTGGGSFSGIVVQGNGGKAELTINNVDVTATNNGAQGIGLQSAGTSPATLAVNGGSLTASGSKGIDYQFGTGTTGSGTPTVTVSNNAIVRANGGIANNSPTSIQYGTGNEENGGIVFDGNTGTVYGDVTLDESLTIDQDETLTIPDGASLTIGSDATLTVDGGKLTGNIPTNGVVLKVTEVKMNKDSLSLEVGESETLTATITPDNATNKAVEWKSDDTSVATVDTSGEVTAVAQGSTTITVTTEDGDKTATCTVTVTQPVTGVTLDKNTLELYTGKRETLIATVQPENATNKAVTWASSNPSVATVENGVVTAVSAGTATITAAAADGSGVSATCAVTVEKPYTPPPYIPPTYAVTTPETTGGTVTVSPSRASRGRTVTITAAPDTGFALESLTVLDSRGEEIALTDKGDGKYTFTMPASKVTVEASFTPAPLPFEDVAPGAWYESAVRYAYTHDIMEGMSATTFQPNGTLSRAMAVQIFYNLEGQPDVSDENLGYPYEDVDAQAWYGNAVYWARITGVATGYGDGTFQPGDSITRQEFAQMLYNYAKYKGYDLSAEGDLSQFPDSGSVADWAEAAMSWANGNELINGHDDGTIDAAGIGTRAQAASILMRFDQNLVEK